MGRIGLPTRMAAARKVTTSCRMPNCHRKLDRDDPIITQRAKEALLFREVKRILEAPEDSKNTKRDLVEICNAILTRKIT